MWGQPREGTEAHKVKQMAEARKKEAKEKGLDSLIVDVYFEKLERLQHKIEVNDDWKKYKHPEIKELKEKEGDKDNDYQIEVTFNFGDNKYTLKRSRSNYREFGDGNYYYLDLYIDEKKAFGLMVDEDSNEYTTNYSPSLITAYANDNWVNDFQEIKKYYEAASKATEIAFAEDPKKTRQMKDDFGISDSDVQTESSNEVQQRSVPSTNTAPITQEKKPIWKRWWFWAIVIYLVLVSLS